MPKSDPDELIACFHRNDIPLIHTGKLDSLIFPCRRGDLISTNTPALVVRIFAFTKEKMFLIQRRATKGKSHAGYYTDSASGLVRYTEHISFEDIEHDAWRELQEEMDTPLIYGRFWKIQPEIRNGQVIRMAYLFFAIVEPIFHPDPIETDINSGFHCESELRLMLEEVQFVSEARQYWLEILDKHIYEAQINSFFNQHPQTFQRFLSSNKEVETNKEQFNKIAAIVGRFQPLHNGHLMVILEMLKHHSKIKIGIGSAQYYDMINNPFTYNERREMILRVLKQHKISIDRIQIYPINDLHNMEKWSNEVIRVLGDFDIFYSNSEWTRRLMQNKGKQIAPLLKFEFEKYNASHVRELIRTGQSISDLVPTSNISYLEQIHAKDRLKNF
ncbi:MAG: adenylyltransferase/cytidyltransferase family protein [Promethearchaeota archaeon]